MQLKNAYKAGLTAAEQEERLLRAALSRIYEIRTIKNDRRIQVSCYSKVCWRFHSLCV